METKPPIPTHGISVDGFCSGNPGPGGYRGVDLSTGEVLFRRNYNWCTNNLAEFMGVVHAVSYVKVKKLDYGVVYSDSAIAIGWFRSQKISSGIDLMKGKDVLEDLRRSLLWLSEQKHLIAVNKWQTKLWGECPADFGNKYVKK